MITIFQVAEALGLPRSAGPSILETHAPETVRILQARVTELQAAIESFNADLYWGRASYGQRSTRHFNYLRQQLSRARHDLWAAEDAWFKSVVGGSNDHR